MNWGCPNGCAHPIALLTCPATDCRGWIVGRAPCRGLARWLWWRWPVWPEPPLGDPGAVPDPPARPDEGDPERAHVEAETRPVVNDQEPAGEQGISSDRPGVDPGGYPEKRVVDDAEDD